jgi:hypothetical protein
MDPLTAATAFATLVGLICNFRQERGERKALDHQKFIEWLEYHHHEELKNLIVNTAALQNEVNNFLNSPALASNQDAKLSEQAISILRQFVNSGAESFFYANYGGGTFSLGWEAGTEIEITELRFLDDDLDKLVQLGLLSPQHTGGETIWFRLTRSAVKFLEAVEKGV